MKIWTVTPNPALDLGGTIDRLVPNEKVYVENETRCPGGNGVNVARVLRRLRIPVTAAGFLGARDDEFQTLLESEGMDTDFVGIQGATRINLTLSLKKSHLQTRLSFPGPRIRPGEKIKLQRKIEALKGPGLLMIGGSLPRGFGTQDLAKLLRVGEKNHLAIVVDSPGDVLREVAKKNVFLVKPNLSEFNDFVQKKVKSKIDVWKEASQWSERIPLICVSSVEGGALLVTPEGAWFGRIPKIKIRSVVGAGDSMVAGMLSVLWRGKIFSRECLRSHPEAGGEILRWGLAASAASLVHEGTAMGSRKEIMDFLRRTKVRKLGLQRGAR